MKPAHPMLARFVVLAAMLLLALIGVVLTDVNKSGAFRYWQWTAVLYALLALGLSWYERRSAEAFRPATLWHELLHWVGLNAAVYLISLYVSIGIVSRFEAALLVLTVLALAVYLAGLYIEISFCFVGVILGLFAALVAFFSEYLYAIAFPLVLVAIGMLFWMLLHRKKPSP